MRERRRALIAGALLLVAVSWFDRPDPLVTVQAGLTDEAPATARAALDLGMLGTFALSWTIQRLN